MIPKIGTMYIDFIRVFPNLSHFLVPEKLKERFDFMLVPDLYHREYLAQTKEEYPRRFVHRLGSLRPLAAHKWKYKFWSNLFDGTSLEDYIFSSLEEQGYFGYLPYIIKPSWKISVEPSLKINQQVVQILNKAKLTLTIRLFPMGATSVHLMAFFNPEEAEVEEFVKIQQIFLRHRLFRITRRNKDSQLLSLEEIFREVRKLVYDSLYTESPRGSLETGPGGVHRIIYIHLLNRMGYPITSDMLKADKKMDLEVQMAAACLIGLRTSIMPEEVDSFLKFSARYEHMRPGDLLRFHPMATLLHVPTCEPHKGGYCLWNNLLNVVELATLQKFLLNKTTEILERSLSPSHRLVEYTYRVSYIQGLANSHKKLRGTYRWFYREIDQKLRISELIEKFSDLLERQSIFQSYEVIRNQIHRFVETLGKIKLALAHAPNLIPRGIEDHIQNVDNIQNQLTINIETLREIADRKRRGDQSPLDAGSEHNANMAILNEISNYRREFLPYYEKIIEQLLDNIQKEKNIDVSNSRKRLLEAKLLGADVPYSLKSVPTFVLKAKDYIETLLDASTEGLGYLE